MIELIIAAAILIGSGVAYLSVVSFIFSLSILPLWGKLALSGGLLAGLGKSLLKLFSGQNF